MALNLVLIELLYSNESTNNNNILSIFNHCRLFGATIALINQYLRLHNMTSPLSLGILVGILFVVYYILWRWLCRKLDKLNNE